MILSVYRVEALESSRITSLSYLSRVSAFSLFVIDGFRGYILRCTFMWTACLRSSRTIKDGLIKEVVAGVYLEVFSQSNNLGLIIFGLLGSRIYIHLFERSSFWHF